MGREAILTGGSAMIAEFVGGEQRFCQVQSDASVGHEREGIAR